MPTQTLPNLASPGRTRRIARGLLIAIEQAKRSEDPVVLSRLTIEGANGFWDPEGQDTLWVQICLKLLIPRGILDRFFAAGASHPEIEKVADCHNVPLALFGSTPIGDENDEIAALFLAPPDYIPTK